MNDHDIEKEVQAKGLTAPRVRLADIEAAIKSIDVVTHVSASGQILRWAVLNMRNGFAITGRPSCSVSPENDDAELGKKIATENAISEAWGLLGYELKSRLAGPTSDQVNRFLTWPVPAHVHPDGAPGQPGRTGTNLLDAPTTQEMLRHVLGG